MSIDRPDMNSLTPEVRAYIEMLESELALLRSQKPKKLSGSKRSEELVESDSFTGLMGEEEYSEPAEPPTTINVITITADGVAKRTPRHLYHRQRRGGMGIFDLEVSKGEPPSILSIADESKSLLLLTNFSRAFRLPVSQIPDMPVRERGSSIVARFNLEADERLVAALPVRAEGYVALASHQGVVRLLRHHIFGEHMKPGTALCDLKFGTLAAACWTPGNAELFVATRQGRAIRFAEKQVPPQGAQGIRLAGEDYVVGITSVSPESGVFMLGSDGRGTIRNMEGFSPNKTPGAGGKNAMDTTSLVASLNVDDQEDLFIISRLSKIIRFTLTEIPQKEGVVQGVICMSLRADQCIAAAVSGDA